MANHVLSLEAPDTMTSCILKITDTSHYNPQAPVTCATLQITVPGFSQSVLIPNTLPGFMFNLTACDLKVQTANCGTQFADLADGIYILKYSVSPNAIVYVEYNHLRITAALTLIQQILCDLDIAACEPNFKVKAKLREVGDIREQLLAAKAKVEFCMEPRIGMEIYKFCLKELNKMLCNKHC